MIHFRNLKVTTMTCIIYLTCRVYIQRLFYLLPVIENETITNGKIVSLRYNTLYRGNMFKASQLPFRNCITINIVMDRKLISVKIFSKGKIQMCGLISKEMAQKTMEKIVEYIQEIQKMLQRIHEEPIESPEVIRFVLDALNHGASWQELLEWDTVYNGEIQYKIKKVMVNFNYDLGFSVNRAEFAKQFNKIPGFKARYTNSSDYCVYLRYYEEERKHMFIIYKSGLVTQSGPNEKYMEHAYQVFHETVKKLRQYVMKPKQDYRKLKFIPIPQNLLESLPLN